MEKIVYHGQEKGDKGQESPEVLVEQARELYAELQTYNRQVLQGDTAREVKEKSAQLNAILRSIPYVMKVSERLPFHPNDLRDEVSNSNFSPEPVAT
jgi:hypothetical protein